MGQELDYCDFHKLFFSSTNHKFKFIGEPNLVTIASGSSLGYKVDFKLFLGEEKEEEEEVDLKINWVFHHKQDPMFNCKGDWAVG